MRQDDAIAEYIALREANSAITRRAEQLQAINKARMEKIGAAFLSGVLVNGTDRIGTAAGNVKREVVHMCSAEDWDTFYSAAEDNPDLIQLLQKRFTQTACGLYIEENGAPPPGVKSYSEVRATFSIPSKKQRTSGETNE